MRSKGAGQWVGDEAKAEAAEAEAAVVVVEAVAVTIARIGRIVKVAVA